MKELERAKELIISRMGNDIDLVNAVVCIDLALRKLGWISIEDKKPPDNCLCWVAVQLEDEPELIVDWDDYFEFTGWRRWSRYNITAYIPIEKPEPPESEE
jgi:hypothetical protein